MKAKVWYLVKRPEGMPKLDDFKLVVEDLEPLQDGEVLFETQYLSVDPYMRYTARILPLNKAMTAGQVAKVLESKNSKYPVGLYVGCYYGWRSHTKLNPDSPPAYLGIPATAESDMMLPTPLSKDGPVSYTKYLGICGIPGMTAYFGFLEICKPQPGEVVLVNGAAGAVGSAVGQIAKIKGCKVIGYAGSDDKVAYMKSLGFDYAFNYKTVNLEATIKEAAPDGIDCYFDNVGGEFTATVIKHMKQYGRISCCGAISTYNDLTTATGVPYASMAVILQELTLSGFVIISRRYLSRWPDAIKQMIKWIAEGKIKVDETIVEGFEKMPAAFIGLLKGENLGKMIVSNVP